MARFRYRLAALLARFEAETLEAECRLASARASLAEAQATVDAWQRRERGAVAQLARRPADPVLPALETPSRFLAVAETFRTEAERRAQAAGDALRVAAAGLRERRRLRDALGRHRSACEAAFVAAAERRAEEELESTNRDAHAVSRGLRGGK